MPFRPTRPLIALLATSALTAPALAEEDRRIEEIQVTATKRVASTQDIPVAVNAMGEQTLEQMDVDVFTDYLTKMPGLTAGGSGPGQSTIYIRGLASTTPNLTVAAAAGLAPNVALYLDEQPVTQVGRNLDVYAADLSRIEVLPGPQGTLFGASSQAGTVRLITNKPDFSDSYGRASASFGFTKGGEESTKVEVMYNAPITDNLAVRGVFFADKQGGYIDNVAGTRTAAESQRFQSAGTRPNGFAVGGGFQDGADLTNVTFLAANNTALVEDDFNDATYTGGRISATYMAEDWTVTVAHTRQQLDAEGVFFTDPTLEDDFSIQRFSEDELEDDFDNTAWTVEGRMGMLEMVYTGAYLNRKAEQTVDYSDYLFIGPYIPYYICDTTVSDPGAGGPTGTCQAPNLFVTSETNVKVWSHELRFTTPAENPLRATAGLFYSDQKLTENNAFTYPGSQFIAGYAPGQVGFPQNGPNPNATHSDLSLRAPGVIFFNDFTRTDEQFGAFAEVTYDITDDLSVTGGLRYHDVKVDLEGAASFSFGNLAAGEDVNAFDAVLDTLFDGDPFPDKAVAEGVIFKGNVSWYPVEDVLLYFTYSEGYRPGLPNRPGGSTGTAGTVPGIVRTDEVTNYELGWKADLFDYQLRFNGNAFFVKISDLQSSVFDPVGSGTNLFFADNAADAEIKGVEGDITYAPAEVPGLTVYAAFSYLDTEITELVGVSTTFAELGSDLAFAPEFQANLRARYEWDIGAELTGHVMPSLAYSDSSFSDIVTLNRAQQDSWTLLGLSAGVSSDTWTAELAVENLTNEKAELVNNIIYARERVTYVRPMTVTVRVGVDF